MGRRKQRSGLRVRGTRGNGEVRAALMRYARWLRTQYTFPIRVPVYLLPGKTLKTRDGEVVSASFFAPWSRMVEPYIRVATGDYCDLEAELGRDSALAAFICSLSHEVVHYFQWLETGKTHERGVAAKARGMLRSYAETVDRP